MSFFFMNIIILQKEKKLNKDDHFLIIKNGHLCPIEVKSSAYKNHESFDYYVKKYNPKKHDRLLFIQKIWHKIMISSLYQFI